SRPRRPVQEIWSCMTWWYHQSWVKLLSHGSSTNRTAPTAATAGVGSRVRRPQTIASAPRYTSMPMIWLGTRDSSIPIPISPAPQVRNNGNRAPVLVASWAVIPISSANSGGGMNSLSWRMLNGPSAGAVWATNGSRIPPPRAASTPRPRLVTVLSTFEQYVPGGPAVRSFHGCAWSDSLLELPEALDRDDADGVVYRHHVGVDLRVVREELAHGRVVLLQGAQVCHLERHPEPVAPVCPVDHGAPLVAAPRLVHRGHHGRERDHRPGAVDGDRDVGLTSLLLPKCLLLAQHGDVGDLRLALDLARRRLAHQAGVDRRERLDHLVGHPSTPGAYLVRRVARRGLVGQAVEQRGIGRELQPTVHVTQPEHVAAVGEEVGVVVAGTVGRRVARVEGLGVEQPASLGGGPLLEELQHRGAIPASPER